MHRLREEIRPTLKKTKFERKATKDDESTEEMDEEMDLRTILIGTFPISLKCYTISLTLPYFFKSKEIEENLVEVEKEHFPTEEKHSQRVITMIPLKEALEGDTGKTYYGNDKEHKTSLCESSL